MKKYIYILLFLILGLIGSIYISPGVQAMQLDAKLVFDRPEPEAQVAKRYRANHGLRASASGQFSADELPRILSNIPEPKKNIWVVDLRQESHGFIDGLPVSWYGMQNKANLGKTAAQIKRDEDELLSALSKQKTITVFQLKKLADGGVAAEKPLTMLPESVETEQQLVTSIGVKYKRLYVLDHNKPEDLQVDSFVSFMKNKVSTKDWLHFHCSGGKGRTSTFIAMFDMIQNANNATFMQIIQRQEQMGNKKLNKMPIHVDKQWKSAQAQERYQFLHEFYAYVRDPAGYKVQSWSAWKKTKQP